MNLDVHLEFAGKTSALDALRLLVGKLKRGPFYIEWAGRNMALRTMLAEIEKRPLMQAGSCADIVNLGFYGGPPGKKTWYKGTLASLLVDSYFCEAILQRGLADKDRIPYADKIDQTEMLTDRRPTPPTCIIPEVKAKREADLLAAKWQAGRAKIKAKKEAEKREAYEMQQAKGRATLSARERAREMALQAAAVESDRRLRAKRDVLPSLATKPVTPRNSPDEVGLAERTYTKPEGMVPPSVDILGTMPYLSSPAI